MESYRSENFLLPPLSPQVYFKTWNTFKLDIGTDIISGTNGATLGIAMNVALP